MVLYLHKGKIEMKSPAHAIKAYMRCGSTALLILDVGEWSVSHTDCCTPRERPPVHSE